MESLSHAEVVRRSFGQQTALFSGPDALFAPRSPSAVSWLEPLDAGMILLDVACGAAHVAEMAAPHVRQAVGIDLTPALLALGADRLREAGITNVLLQEGDANALPFVDGSFDVVACRASMHHFPDPAQALREMVRVCRPGGRVVLSDIVAPSAEVRDAYDALHTTLDPSHVRALLESELAELASRIVGPVAYGETSATPPIPLDAIVTGVSDREAATAMLRRELDGGPPTGLEPEISDGEVLVRFTNTVLHASRA